MTDRTCGGCTACCHVVPVKEIGLKSFTRCPHLNTVLHAKGPGCGIYERRPYSCRSWRCMWLRGDIPVEMRPDRCGVVIDETLDLVMIAGREVLAAQLWVLPEFEEGVLDDPRANAIIHSLLDPARTKIEGRGRIEAVVMWMSGNRAWGFHRNRKGRVERTTTTLNEELLGDERSRMRRLMERTLDA